MLLTNAVSHLDLWIQEILVCKSGLSSKDNAVLSGPIRGVSRREVPARRALSVEVPA